MSEPSTSDPNNPSGALPGDPRHGLSEEQLKEYYRGLGPSWIVHAVLSDEGGAEAVDAVMDEHLAYLRSERERIRFAGPSLANDATTKAGSIWLIDARDRAAAEQWMAHEPFTAAGAFSSVTLTRWSSSMQIRQGEYPRTEGWKQFAITAFDGSDGAERRNAVADAHHRFQASVMDRYVARGPMLTDDGSELIGSFMIVEFPDRTACEQFWANEPLNTGGVFAEVRIDPWRYGAGLG
ncbi:MAG: YciI family protein [Acidimicrobiia bacterium]|nr:YciI family protein [Acidimicrobiia bacterium]